MKPDRKAGRKTWWKHASGRGSRNGRFELLPAETSSGDPTPPVVTPRPFAIIRINSVIIFVVGVSGPG